MRRTERTAGPLHPLGMIATAIWLRESKADAYLSPFSLRPPGAPCPCLLTIHDVWPLRLKDAPRERHSVCCVKPWRLRAASRWTELGGAR